MMVMSSDDFEYELKRPIRRKRTSDTEHFIQDWSSNLQYQLAAKREDAGLHCKECRKRYTWKSFKIVYEMQGTDIHRIWFCEYGHMVRDDNMEGH